MVGNTNGTDDDPKLNDSILKLMSSKGGLIDMNDDTDPVMANWVPN